MRMEFTKRMGHTVYHVQVHPGECESDVSFEDALVRLIVNDSRSADRQRPACFFRRI